MFNNLLLGGLLVLAILAVGYILLYNRLQIRRVKVDEGYAGIDVALEKRFDVLTAQIEAVKKYLSHEYTLFTDVTALRTGADQEEKARQTQGQLTEEALNTLDKEISKHAHDMAEIKSKLQKAASQSSPEKRKAAREKLSQSGTGRSQRVDQRVAVLTDAHRDLSGVGAGIDALSEQYPILNSWVAMDKFQMSITNAEEHLQAARRLYNANVSLYNQSLVTFPWSIVATLSGMDTADFYEIEEKKRDFSVRFD